MMQGMALGFGFALGVVSFSFVVSVFGLILAAIIYVIADRR